MIRLSRGFYTNLCPEPSSFAASWLGGVVVWDKIRNKIRNN